MRKNPDFPAKYSETLFARAALYDIRLYFSRMDRQRYRIILETKQRAGVLTGATYLGPGESEKFLIGGRG